MKLFLPIVLATAGALCAADLAQSIASGDAETQIYAKTVRADLKARTAVYHGSVKVEDPRVSMTCELLRARMPAEGKRVDSIIAETNVVIYIPQDGATNTATADRAVYTYAIEAGVTNEVLELTGAPVIRSSQATAVGTRLILDITTGVISGENVLMKYRAAATTNSLSTNAGVEPKPSNP
jgi:lipopolysaccharide export system protein LptA